MENKRGSEIFLGVVGVTTLLVAIIGATFAYFSATARSGNEAIAIKTTTLSLGYDDVARLSTNMIPSTYGIAEYSAFDATWKQAGQQIAGDANGDGVVGEDEKITTKGECIDQAGNSICSVYEFYIGNPSTSTSMNITGKITSVTNEFQNLMFAIYDEAGKQVIAPTKMPESGKFVALTALNQELIGYVDVATETDYDVKKPSTYKVAGDPTKGEKTNVRHYTMLIWLNEAGSGNVEEAGKMFTAGISFDTGTSSGVTGVIGVSNATTNKVVTPQQ